MLAILGVILAVVAAVLKLVDKYPNAILWLVIFAIILVGAEVAWGWGRSGHTYRHGT